MYLHGHPCLVQHGVEPGEINLLLLKEAVLTYLNVEGSVVDELFETVVVLYVLNGILHGHLADVHDGALPNIGSEHQIKHLTLQSYLLSENIHKLHHGQQFLSIFCFFKLFLGVLQQYNKALQIYHGPIVRTHLCHVFLIQVHDEVDCVSEE